MNNLPPGVNENDIPGNRPEDDAWEKLHEEIDDDSNEYGLADMEAWTAWKLGLAAYLKSKELGAVYPFNER